MNRETNLPSTQEAQVALESVAEMASAGLRRGLYPRWFAATTALWAGSIAALIGLDSPFWLLIFFAGIAGLCVYREKRGAWVQEIRSWREFWLVVPGGVILLCGVALAGIIGWQHFGLFWTPIAAGMAISLGLFAVMELSYRPIRVQTKEEPGS